MRPITLITALAVCVAVTGHFDHALAEEEQGLEAKLKRSSGTTRVDLLVSLAKERCPSSPSAALKHATRAAELAKELGYDKGRTDALVAAAKAHLYGSKTVEALKISARAVEVARSARYDKGLADAFNVKGVAHRRAGDYDQALEAYYRSVKIREASGDMKGVAASYNNIGLVHWNLKQYRKALDAYSRSLKLTRKHDPKARVDGLHNNIGLVHFDLGDYRRALRHHLKALESRKDGKQRRQLASTLNNIAIVKLALGRHDEALKLLQRTLRINQQLGYTWGVANVHQNIGEVYLKKGDLERAELMMNRGLELAKKSSAKQLISEGHKLLSRLNSAKGDHKLALHHFERHAEVKDSILNQKTAVKMAEFTAKLGVLKQEQEIALLTRDQKIRELQLRRQRILRNSLLAGLGLVLVTAIVILNRYRLKARAHREILAAMERIKTLQGLLPICASCKKIRDDKGYWHQVEAYVGEHSDAEFSHGLCPECVDAIYPEHTPRTRKPSDEISSPGVPH